MEQFEVECLVVGAGVVGLAVARELALQGHEVWLIEQESQIGMQTSSRNSEVIHAGIYYPEHSLKAKLCFKGKRLLYKYCEENKIPFKQCGKLIVAKDHSQLDQLKRIEQHALANGVGDLKYLIREQVQQIEPELNVEAALLSPSTGILDSHVFMHQLLTDYQNSGGQLVLNTSLAVAEVDNNHSVLFDLVGQNAQLKAKYCVNAAGLNAINLFKGVERYPQETLPKAYYAKGSYFSYGAKAPFSHLVYPIPESGGLGIHLTLDMAGTAKFGPDVEWLTETVVTTESATENLFDYVVDPKKSKDFVHAIRQYWPNVDASKLSIAYAGIRPKVSAPDKPAGDFVIQDESVHNIKGLVNLLGIESPGLTASLAIADHVLKLLALE